MTLWQEPGENVPPVSSQHNIFLPEINLDFQENDISTANCNAEPDSDSGDQVPNSGDTSLYGTAEEAPATCHRPATDSGNLRRSQHQTQPSYKFLSNLAIDTDSEDEQ